MPHHGWLTVKCDALACIAQIDISPTVVDASVALRRAGWHKTAEGHTFCPTHTGSGMQIVLALQLDNIQNRMEQMSDTLDQIKAKVDAFIATLTTDVTAAAATISDQKATIASQAQKIADLEAAVPPPSTVDFQPSFDAGNTQLSLLEAATANAKS